MKASEVLDKWRKRYAAICPKHIGGFEKMPSFCWCESAAQVASYIETVIPDGYQGFEISDFDGTLKKGGKKVVSDKVVSLARLAVINYCWEGIDPDDIGNFDLVQWYPKSAMEQRHRDGHSIIIFGDPFIRELQNGLVKVTRKSLGRTLLAAVVMKEAIRTRLRPFHQADTYAWVSFPILCEKLMRQAIALGRDDRAFDPELADWEEADWLCVDGIEKDKSTDASKTFRNRVLDSFFAERMKNSRPNILVFQDDLNTLDDLRSEFGNSINSIISAERTAQVKLLESK